jgi:hypothetical protein
VEALVLAIATACEAWLAEQGLGPDDDPGLDDEDAQGVLQAASVAGTLSTGPRAGSRVRRVRVFAGQEVPMPPLCAGCDGYTLHAGTVTAARVRVGLERMCRYVLRPPLARCRLERHDDGTVTLGMKRVFADGTAAFRFTAAELTERLCALVPLPYVNQTLYHGLFAARSAWRAAVVPRPRHDRPDDAEARAAKKLARKARVRISSRHLGWAELLAREFQVDGWRCPRCGGPLRLRCVVVRTPATVRVLRGLAPSRGPPQLAPLVRSGRDAPAEPHPSACRSRRPRRVSLSAGSRALRHTRNDRRSASSPSTATAPRKTAPTTRVHASYPPGSPTIRGAAERPIGEGAGYAGGIVSSALDGLRAAQAITGGPA